MRKPNGNKQSKKKQDKEKRRRDKLDKAFDAWRKRFSEGK